MGVVFRLYDSDGNVGLHAKDVVCPARRPAADETPAHDDPTLGDRVLFADLGHLVPPRPAQRRRDELRADVALTEPALVRHANNLS